MKTLLIFLLVFPALSRSQDSSRIQYSKYEKFVNESGRLIKTVKAKADDVADAEVYVLISTDVADGTTLKSVTLSQTKSILFSRYFIGALSIDIEELADFIKALKYIQLQIEGEKPAKETSLYYSTKNGVVISAGYVLSGPGRGWSLSFGKVYQYSRAEVSNSGIIIKPKEISQVADVLQKCVEYANKN